MVRSTVALAAIALSVALGPAAASAQNSYGFTDAATSAVRYDVAPARPTMSCPAVAGLATMETTIISTRVVPAADGVPEHCRVTGLIQPEIRFEANLPANWNRRFYMHGNGGFAGETPETGNRPLYRANALKQGFATATTNTGHDAAAEPLASFAVRSWAARSRAAARRRTAGTAG
jgi:feruloyl esterase